MGNVFCMFILFYMVIKRFLNKHFVSDIFLICNWIFCLNPVCVLDLLSKLIEISIV